METSALLHDRQSAILSGFILLCNFSIDENETTPLPDSKVDFAATHATNAFKMWSSFATNQQAEISRNNGCRRNLEYTKLRNILICVSEEEV